MRQQSIHDCIVAMPRSGMYYPSCRFVKDKKVVILMQNIKGNMRGGNIGRRTRRDTHDNSNTRLNLYVRIHEDGAGIGVTNRSGFNQCLNPVAREPFLRKTAT